MLCQKRATLSDWLGKRPHKLIHSHIISTYVTTVQGNKVCISTVCGKHLMNMSNITFEVPGLSTVVFKKSSEKNILMIIFVVKSLNGFDWNNVGPASQTVATLCHNWANISCYPVVAFRGIKRHPYGSQSKHGTITQFCFNVGPASNTIDQH